MPRLRLAPIALVLLAAAACAQPAPDEDALPEGAIARLGSRQRRWRTVFDFTFVDSGKTLLLVHAGPQLAYRDVASGKLLRVRTLGTLAPEAAAISGDGRILAVQRRERIELWDVAA